MGQYTNKGLYNSYDKNHRERDKLDYYATKPGETRNLLETLGYDFSGMTILEPCCGGGHMVDDIQAYLDAHNQIPRDCVASDIMDRGYSNMYWRIDYGLDFLEDDYPHDEADVVIMNPPFATIEPFTIRALEIAKKKLIVFARLQFLESLGRYEKIFKNNPPSDVYVYIDRIQCWKQGVEPEGSSAQAYAWFVWDRENPTEDSKIHWLKRVDKEKPNGKK